jgi:hypothetical protein
LGRKFVSCAARAVSASAAHEALTMLRAIDDQPRIRQAIDVLVARPLVSQG